MMTDNLRITRWQQLCLGFISMLSPIIRLLPRHSAEIAGSSAWVSALFAAVPVTLLFLLVLRLFKNASEGEGFGELFIRILGKGVGRAVIVIFTLWLIFYTGFTLRSGADRYITSAYHNSRPEFFILVLLSLAVLSCLSRFKTLGRVSEVFFPLMALVLALVFGFAFQDVSGEFLSAPAISELPGIIRAVHPSSIILSISVYFGFLEGRVADPHKRRGTVFFWFLLMFSTVFLLCITTIGCFGGELTSNLDYPFFVMIRNISLFDFIDRLETPVMALWVITDFVMVSTLMFIITGNLRLCMGLRESEPQLGLTALRHGKWLVWLCAVPVLVSALTMAPDAGTLRQLSQVIVPWINTALIYGLLPAIVLVGLIRKRI